MPNPATTPGAGGPLPPFQSWRPSVNRPRGPRLRIWLLLGVGFMVAAAALAALVILILPKPRPAPAVLPTRAETTAARQTFVVKPGEIMSTVLRRADVPDSTADRLIRALREAGFNFRRMRPGDSLQLFAGEAGLFRVQYQQSYERVYQLDIGPGDVRSSMLFRYVRAVQDTVRGAIKSSFYESLLEAGEKPALIADYTDIFGWEIDFFSETQTGDSFVILFERRLADSTFVGYGPVLAARYQGRVGDFLGLRFTDPEGRTDYYNAEGQCLRKTFLKSPLRFSRISSFFGRRFHPIRRIPAQHQGIDYAAPTGTPVCCIGDGRVSSAGWNSGYGRLVEVSHANGFVTRYGHLSGFGKGIRRGERVEQGQVVGYVGSTGMSTGPHLHYEVRKFGSAVNPLRLDPPRHEPVKQVFASAFRAHADSLRPVLVRTPPPPPPGPAPR